MLQRRRREDQDETAGVCGQRPGSLPHPLHLFCGVRGCESSPASFLKQGNKGNKETRGRSFCICPPVSFAWETKGRLKQRDGPFASVPLSLSLYAGQGSGTVAKESVRFACLDFRGTALSSPGDAHGSMLMDRCSWIVDSLLSYVLPLCQQKSILRKLYSQELCENNLTISRKKLWHYE